MDDGDGYSDGDGDVMVIVRDDGDGGDGSGDGDGDGDGYGYGAVVVTVMAMVMVMAIVTVMGSPLGEKGKIRTSQFWIEPMRTTFTKYHPIRYCLSYLFTAKYHHPITITITRRIPIVECPQ